MLSVDFHTHILPRVDDGSSSVSESIKMLKAEREQGVKAVIATPHFYADRDNAEDFFLRRECAARALADAVKGKPLPQVILGAEVYYFSGIERWSILNKLSIVGTDYILIEMPSSGFSADNISVLKKFKSKTGLTPIIAHIERYLTMFNAADILEQLASCDVLIQMNASALLKGHASHRALKWLKSEYIHLLGSDCHSSTWRSPNLAAAEQIILKKLGKDAINRLIELEKTVLKVAF